LSGDAERQADRDGAKARKPRADALRNRDRLVVAAKAAFAQSGPDASLDDIARRAEVGIGTLYRHFPTRDAIVEAVYRREVEQLAEAAPRLLQSHPPDVALREWMLVFIDYIATKKLIAPALSAIVSGSPDLYTSSSARITEAIGLLVDSGKMSGAIRADADPGDLLRALVGFAYVNIGSDWQASARRLIDILIDGLRASGRQA
jgi:AcrR family transcriptional regulator